MNRFEIWSADLDPAQGTEAGKKRPVLIVQSDSLNEIKHPSTLILPITSKIKNDSYPLRIRISKDNSKLKQDSDIVVDQIRAIDNRRLISKIDDLPVDLTEKVNKALGFVLEIW